MPDGRGVAGMVEKREDINMHKLSDIKTVTGINSIGNIVNNIIITSYSVGWVLDLSG